MLASGEMISESTWLLGQSLAGAARLCQGLAEGVASLAEVDARARENMRADLDLMAADLLAETTRTRQALRISCGPCGWQNRTQSPTAGPTIWKQAWTVLAGVALLFLNVPSFAPPHDGCLHGVE